MVEEKQDMSTGDPTLPPLRRTGPNWLLRGLVILSLGVHAVIFLQVSGLYVKKALNYIELTVEDVDRPRARSIPRPRLRPKRDVQPDEVKRIKAPSHRIPHFRPLKITPGERRFSENLMEDIAMPEIPGTPELTSPHWEPVRIEAGGEEFETPNSYLEMVRMKIERHKRYPQKAEGRQIEGAVVVGFVIGTEGDVQNEKIVKSSGHRILDGAALSAVKGASPFPSPPRRLFGGKVPLTITIVFELT